MEATRESELAALANKYELEISKKRRKNLMEVDQTAFESYKAGIEIAYACKVRTPLVTLVNTCST